MRRSSKFALLLAAGFFTACGGGSARSGASASGAPSTGRPSPTASPSASASTSSQCSGSVHSSASPGAAPVTPSGLLVPLNLHISAIANIRGARELVALPNGDLVVGTGGDTVYIIPNAEAAGAADAPAIFASISDAPVAGVSFAQAQCTIYVASQHGVYSIPYHDGDLSARSVTRIASVRSGSVAPNSDGDVHTTTSVAASTTTLFAGVGSSCNSCVEVDPTRATFLGGHFNTAHPWALQNRTARAE